MKKAFLAILLISSALIASAQKTKKNKNDQNSSDNQITSQKVTVTNSATPPALPVLQTYVPPDVVKAAIEKYGTALYCIKQVRAADGKIAYMVGVIERGELKSVMITEDLKFA